LPIVVVMSFIMCAVHGLIAYYPVVLLHQLGVYAGTVGFGLMLDTVLSPPVAPPGANPFKTPKQPDGFAKQLLLMGSMIICMLIALPGGIGSFIYIVGGKDDMVLIISGVIQLVIGAALFIIGISTGGKLYDRHSSMMLQRVAKFNTN
ncbi:MAG: transporter, partial [Rothia dentocariosa]